MANHRSLEHSYREMRMRAALQNLVEEVELDEVIMNSNSCGQGHDPEHSNHPFHATIMKHGYNYSHSTPVKQKDGATINYHTYKHHANRDKNVSVVKPPGMDQHRWDTSTSGSGRQATQGWHSGTLDRHLKGRKIKPLVNHTDLKEDTIEEEEHHFHGTASTYHKDKSEWSVDSTKFKIRAVSRKHAFDKAIDLLHKQYPNHTNHEVTHVDPVKEEVEVIDEISKKTLGKYIHTAVTRHGLATNIIKNTTDKDEREFASKYVDKRKKGISTAINKVYPKAEDPIKVKATEEVEIVTELAPAAPNPMKQKMDAQRQQVEKQKDQLRMQLAQQKAAKQEQAMKQKGEKSLEKIKEDEVLDERMVKHVRTFDRASKLQKLHAQQYTRLSAGGNLAKAEMHRKRAAEYKRIMYTARDNPDKLPSV